LRGAVISKSVAQPRCDRYSRYDTSDGEPLPPVCRRRYPYRSVSWLKDGKACWRGRSRLVPVGFCVRHWETPLLRRLRSTPVSALLTPSGTNSGSCRPVRGPYLRLTARCCPSQTGQGLSGLISCAGRSCNSPNGVAPGRSSSDPGSSGTDWKTPRRASSAIKSVVE
jgi:hypothetical protein